MLTVASQELSQMPAYDLTVRSDSSGDSSTLVCTVRNITRLEAYCNGVGLEFLDVPASGIVTFRMSKDTSPITIKGFTDSKLVGKSIVSAKEV